MDQVKELLDNIEAQKKKGVTGASVMFAFYKCRVQPIQQHHRLGFKYTGPADPSRMCTEELSDEAALQRFQRARRGRRAIRANIILRAKSAQASEYSTSFC
jgi:hypothetical protein